METKKVWIKPELLESIFEGTETPPKDPGTDETSGSALS